jgi:hypothetical protein
MTLKLNTFITIFNKINILHSCSSIMLTDYNRPTLLKLPHKRQVKQNKTIYSTKIVDLYDFIRDYS